MILHLLQIYHLQITFNVQILPSQFNPVESREKPLWHSQVKLPGVFWQIPFDPQSEGCDPHSLLSKKLFILMNQIEKRDLIQI